MTAMELTHNVFIFCLMLVNGIFMMFGLALIVVGLYCRQSGNIETLAEENLPEPDKFDNFLRRWGIEDPTIRKYTSHNYDDVTSILNVSINYMFSVGVAVFVLGLIGTINSSGKSKVFGILYICGIVVLTIVISYIHNIFQQGKASEFIKENIKSVFLPKYKGARHYDISSIGINVVMSKFKCCGITDYKDFERSPLWNKTYTLSKNTVIVVKAPLACCKLNDTFPEGIPIDRTCITQPDENNSFYKKGCGNEIDKMANIIRDPVILWTAILIGTQILSILMFAFILYETKEILIPPELAAAWNRSFERKPLLHNS